MARNVTLNDLLKARREKTAALHQLETELTDLEDLIARIERYGRNGKRPVRRPRPRARRVGRFSKQSELPLPAQEKPTVWEALTALLKEHPGITVSNAIARLIGRTGSAAKDERKMLSTRLAQFVKAKKIVRKADKLYLLDQAA